MYFFNDSLREEDGFTFYSAGPLEPTGRVQPTTRTRRTYYRDQARGDYVPIPQGFEAPMPAGGIDGFEEEANDMFG
jgi:hypothetical protein